VSREEGELIRRCLDGHQDACAQLVERFAPLVGTVIWRATGDRSIVDDLAQETFLRVFRGLPYFNARSKVSTWIYTIAHRVAIDHLRQAGRSDVEHSADDSRVPVDALVAREPSPEVAAAREEIEALVQEHIAQLPEKYRLALVYATVDGLDYDSIGAALGVPTGTVKTLVFRGKQMLKTRIEATLHARCKL
jgi:RNA polymerase sigma-70 factor (ECF subfamily)